MDNNWDSADKALIDELSLTSSMTCKEVKEKIKTFLHERYNGKVSKQRLKLFTDDFTESVCLKLGIAQD